MMKILYTGDTVDNLKDTDVSPGLWGVILYLLTAGQKSLFYFYFYFTIILPFKLTIYMKFKKKQDDAGELKEANKAFLKGHLQNKNKIF